VLQGGPHAALLPLLRASPHLVDALQRVGTIAQMTVLRPAAAVAGGATAGGAAAAAAAAQSSAEPRAAAAAVGEEPSVCVLNTHLFYHPRAPHIRTLHMAALLAEADRFIAEAAPQQSPESLPAVLLCGDLNSDLNEGIPGEWQNGTSPHCC